MLFNIFCIIFSLYTFDHYSKWVKLCFVKKKRKKKVLNLLLKSCIHCGYLYRSIHLACRLTIWHRLVFMKVMKAKKWGLRYNSYSSMQVSHLIFSALKIHWLIQKKMRIWEISALSSVSKFEDQVRNLTFETVAHLVNNMSLRDLKICRSCKK